MPSPAALQQTSLPYNGALGDWTIIQPHQIVRPHQLRHAFSEMARPTGWFALILALAIAAAAVLASFPAPTGPSTCRGGQPAHLCSDAGPAPFTRWNGSSSKPLQLVARRRVNGTGGVADITLQTSETNQLAAWQLPGSRPHPGRQGSSAGTALLENFSAQRPAREEMAGAFYRSKRQARRRFSAASRAEAPGSSPGILRRDRASTGSRLSQRRAPVPPDQPRG